VVGKYSNFWGGMQGFWGRRVFFRIGFLVGDLIMKSSGCPRGCAELVKRLDIARISEI